MLGSVRMNRGKITIINTNMNKTRLGVGDQWPAVRHATCATPVAASSSSATPVGGAAPGHRRSTTNCLETNIGLSVIPDFKPRKIRPRRLKLLVSATRAMSVLNTVAVRIIATNNLCMINWKETQKYLAILGSWISISQNNYKYNWNISRNVWAIIIGSLHDVNKMLLKEIVSFF